MAHCQLGNLRWRVDPTDVSWSYQLDTAVIPTLGGQVIQILGATLSDLVVSGDFGHEWIKNADGDSWRMANSFHRQIQMMMDKQSQLPFTGTQNWGTKYVKAENAWIHKPWTFIYQDGIHDWKFQVLVKAVVDPLDSSSLSHTVSRPNYQYQLSLFVVQADSDVVATIASDAFLSRIAKGIGWSKANYHGATTAKDVQDIVMANGGSIANTLAKALGGTPLTIPADPKQTPPPAKTKTKGAGAGAGSATTAEGRP